MIFVRRDRKVFWLATVAMMIALAPQFLRAQIEPSSKACSPKFHQSSITVDGYFFTTYQELNLKNESACLEVARAGLFWYGIP